MPYNKENQKFLADLGAKIRRVRESRGWSQEELGFRSGLHRTYISSIECGERNISAINLKRIVETLGVNIADIFPDTEKRYSRKR